jgi:hypothetical protein
MTVHDLSTPAAAALVGRPARRMPAAGREIGLLVLLWLGYTLARLLGDDDPGNAVGNAEALLEVERALHLDVELWANDALHAVPGLALASSFWYASLHYIVTTAVLVWAYRAAPALYRRARTALVVGSAAGLAGFIVVPMAPPRMLPGYVDTLATTSGSGWWAGQASAPDGMGSLTNQLAAMPSLHVGWAVWCAWVVLLLTRRRILRLLAVGYAVVTTVVVVVTANHWVLDAVAGAAVVALGVAVSARLRGSPAPRHMNE